MTTIPIRGVDYSDELGERWVGAVAWSKDELGEEDATRLGKYENAQLLTTEIGEMCKFEQNWQIAIHLQRYPSKIQCLDAALQLALGNRNPPISTAAYWGVIHLMLELAMRSELLLSQISPLWLGFALNLQIFDAYRNDVSQNAVLRETIFEILQDFFFVTVSAVKTIKLIKPSIKQDDLEHDESWIDLKLKFKNILESMRQNVRVIKDSSEVSKIAQKEAKSIDITGLVNHQSGIEGDNDGTLVAKSGTEFKLFGREDLLSDLERILRPQPDNIQSLAIWGTGGVGKTQIALEFAHRQRLKGVKYILWISSEHHSESAKSFTQIANLLGLKGATTSKGHEQNKLLVLHWLQHTQDSWLLVYDNLENQTLLQGSMPSCGSGSILVTCRSVILASSVANHQVEIPMLTVNEGSNLMLRELGIEEPTVKDRELASAFAEELGGLSLAIDLMARHMRTRNKTLDEFLPYYRDHRRRLHRNPARGKLNMYYDGELESLWEISFRGLDDLAVQVFRVICMLAPDRIPSKILCHEAVVQSKTSEEESTKPLDPEDLEEIILKLVDLSLVKTSHASTMLSVHRLVQIAFREHQKNQAQAETFTRACRILHDSFPQQKKGFPLFNHWKVCESLVEHVQMLCQRYTELCQTQQLLYLEDFSYLLSDCGRYLCEIGRYNAAKHVVNTGFDHCGDRATLPLSNLCTDMGAILNEQGNDKHALQSFKRALTIREELLSPNDSEIANAFSNYAIAQLGTGKESQAALEWLLRALEIDESKPREIKRKVLRLRHFNLCFAYKALENWVMFMEHLTKATLYVKDEFGENSRYLVISNNHLADLHRKERNFDEAYRLCELAKVIAEKEVATSPWVSASIYKMGHIRLLQKRPVEALQLLEVALQITNLNEREKGDQGDIARVLDKIAQAHAMKGDSEKSAKARDRADKIYQDLIGSGLYDPVGDEAQKWEFLVCIKFR